MLVRSTHRAATLLLALALLLKIGATPGAEVHAERTVVLTFIEVRVEMRGHASDALRQSANARHDRRMGSQKLIVMQEIARPERFVALQRETSATLPQHEREPAALTAGLADDLIAPPDQRLNRDFGGVDAAAGAQVDAGANFYIVTHVDIASTDRAQVEGALRRLTASARQTEGNRGFEILQQVDRPNHFNLISAWTGEAPFRAFVASAETREFRKTVAPLLGSPYDERLFRRVD